MRAKARKTWLAPRMCAYQFRWCVTQSVFQKWQRDYDVIFPDHLNDGSNLTSSFQLQKKVDKFVKDAQKGRVQLIGLVQLFSCPENRFEDFH